MERQAPANRKLPPSLTTGHTFAASVPSPNVKGTPRFKGQYYFF